MTGSTSLTIVNDAMQGVSQKTVVVFGAARGGTSAVSGCLRELGVAMPGAHPLKHEWSPIAYEEVSINIEKTRQQIRATDLEHDVWGWKSPKDLFSFSVYASMLRNAHVIVVFRDPMNVAQSINRYESLPFEIGLTETLAVYNQISEMVSMASNSMALCSYGKILDNPTQFVGDLCAWLGLNATAEQLTAASSFISPDKSYQSVSADRSRSEIDESELTRDRLRAFNSHIPKAIAKYVSATSIVREQLESADRQVAHLKNLLFNNLKSALSHSQTIVDDQVLYQLFTLPYEEFQKVIADIFGLDRQYLSEMFDTQTASQSSMLDGVKTDRSCDGAPTEEDPAVLGETAAVGATCLLNVDVMRSVYDRTKKQFVDRSSQRAKIQNDLDDFSAKIDLVRAVVEQGQPSLAVPRPMLTEQ